MIQQQEEDGGEMLVKADETKERRKREKKESRAMLPPVVSASLPPTQSAQLERVGRTMGKRRLGWARRVVIILFSKGTFHIQQQHIMEMPILQDQHQFLAGTHKSEITNTMGLMRQIHLQIQCNNGQIN